MPYTASNLPKSVRKLPGHGRRIFSAAFNSAHRQYGDETRAFKTAWAAVKTKFKKSGDRWVKQDAQGGDEMKRLLADLKPVYDSYINQVPIDEMVNAKDAMGVIVQAMEASDGAKSLRSVEEKCILALGFKLEQDYNYNRYKEGTETYATAHHNDYPGSLQHRIRSVCNAAHENEEVSQYLGNYGFILAVYPDYFVSCALEDPDNYEADYWKVNYTFDDDTFDVAFGDAEPVDVGTIVVPHGTIPQETYDREAADNDEGQSQAANGQDYKTDNGQKFSKGAYLIIGDPDKPSTWKVRIEETPGNVTVAQLGRAHAALTKGFRGNTTQAPGDAKSKALSRLKSLYKDKGATWPGDSKSKTQSQFDAGAPEWLRQGLEPPGGDEVLIQSWSYLLQAEGYDEASGTLHVKGTATTADVINSKRQVYPIEVWQDNLPSLATKIEQGKLVGEVEHPAGNLGTLDRTCIKYTRIWQDGNEIKFTADILPTEPYGKNLQMLIQNGVAVDISSRGRGTTKVGEWKGVANVAIVQRGFRCEAFDAVGAGASPGSTITDYAMAQSSEAANKGDEEDEMTPELKAQLEQMTAQNEKISAFLETLAQSAGKTETKTETKPDDKTTAKSEGDVGAGTGTSTAASGTTQTQAQNQNSAVDAANDAAMQERLARLDKITAAQEMALVRGAVEPLVQGTVQSKKWGTQWGNLLRLRLTQAIEDGRVKSLDDLAGTADKAVKDIEILFQNAPRFPGNGFVFEPSAGEKGPKTPGELLDLLVADLPDTMPSNGLEHFLQKDENGNPIVPGHFRTPRRQCRQILENMARYKGPDWDGPNAIMALTRLAQGYDPYRVQEDFLNQSLTDGSTAVSAGGAPQSAIFIFPLVRRVFPQLIATELASVQPMDRPNGSIFYLSAYRVTPGVDQLDESSATVSNRTRIDRSDSFSDSYANDPGEGNTANLIQLRLASISVTAQNKKLYAQWTIEEMQDLRSYHGLDAALELVGNLSREIALEWNQIVLKELLNGATGSNRNFGTTAPSGYTQKEWDESITRYIDAASNDIFKKRHGDITHIIAGPDAWVKLSAAFRVGTDPRSGPEPEQYAGVTLTPWMPATMPNVKTYKTSFWAGVHTNTVMVIRRGQDWSDTAYVWAPYMDYVSPTLTLPDVFTQKQGIMSRIAHQVVVGDAIGTITINSGVTGVPL